MSEKRNRFPRFGKKNNNEATPVGIPEQRESLLPREVTGRLEFYYVNESCSVDQVPCDLSYNVDDPLVISLHFYPDQQGSEQKPWSFAYDLIKEGRFESTDRHIEGGDVIVSPVASSEGESMLSLLLKDRECNQYCELYTSAKAVNELIEKIEIAVDRHGGREHLVEEYFKKAHVSIGEYLGSHTE